MVTENINFINHSCCGVLSSNKPRKSLKPFESFRKSREISNFWQNRQFSSVEFFERKLPTLHSVSVIIACNLSNWIEQKLSEDDVTWRHFTWSIEIFRISIFRIFNKKSLIKNDFHSIKLMSHESCDCIVTENSTCNNTLNFAMMYRCLIS